MNITVEQLGDQHRILNIEITKEDYKPAFDKQIKELGKKIQMPGFRVGHTPISIVQKKFGDSVLAEELNKIVNEQLGNYLKENNVSILGDAIPVRDERLELVYSEPRDYIFSYEIGIQPKIDLEANLNKEKTFTRYRIPAKEEEINQELERLQKRYGIREDVEVAEEGDVIYVHLQELNDDGTMKENGIHAHSFFNHEMLTDEGLKIFKDVKKDFAQNIDDIFSVFKGDKKHVAKNVLMLENTDDEVVNAINPKFECKVERISKLIPAAIDDKFFNEVVKEYGEVEDEQQLRNKIKEVIEGYNDRSTEVSLENDIFKYLSETTNVELPDAFLRNWYKRTLDKEVSDEEFDNLFTKFINQLKQSLIFQKVQKEHGIDVQKEEIIQEAFETVKVSYGHLGDELVNYVAKNNLQDKNFIENMQDRIMQKKFFEALKNYVTIEDQPITLEEFQKLNKKEEAYAE
ncbi:MAG: hypothetical protein H7Y00_11805 [Fimbriimonadaceae bacterium]|nr:hypothetical protein [Chitinophagales bacterium]